MKIEIKGNKVSIDVSDLFYLLHDAYDDEFDAEKFIDDLGWLPQIRKKVIETLKETYSRKTYNPDVHKERDELLSAMKEKEIEYFSSYVADLIEEGERWSRNYWKLWHWYHDKLGPNFGIKEFPPDTENIDHTYRQVAEEYIKSLIHKKINAPKEAHSENENKGNTERGSPGSPDGAGEGRNPENR